MICRYWLNIQKSESGGIWVCGWKCGGCVDKLLHSYEDLASSRAVLPGNKPFSEKLNLQSQISYRFLFWIVAGVSVV